MSEPFPLLMYLFAFVGATLGFFFLLALIGLWFKDRKNRRLHEENIRALERGLVPPEWVNQSGHDARRMGWLWLALGLPIFIAFALGVGTFLLVDAMRWGRDFTGLLVAIWLVGGAVGLAAVIMGGLGMMADQRQRSRRPPIVELARVGPPRPEAIEDRIPAAERIRKPESP